MIIMFITLTHTDHGLAGNGRQKKYVEPTAEELKQVTGSLQLSK